MLLGGVLMLLFWGIVIALIFLAVRALSQSNRPGERGDYPSRRERSPEDILKERYARGDITTEEYRDMRRELLET
jgi:putative membrane protein